MPFRGDGSDGTYAITDYFGDKILLAPHVGLYTVQDFMGEELPGLAIVLDEVNPINGERDQYDVLTVSFGEFIGMKNCAYIDTNNCSFADQLLKYGIAEDTGFTMSSGFCVYPLWKFDEDFLKAIGGEQYKEYSDAYDNYMHENEYSEAWELVSRKEVPDADGFMTEYSWYTDGDVHIFIFGDSEVYNPDNTNPDWECETEAEARKWFDNYEGFVKEEKLAEQSVSSKDVFKGFYDCLLVDEWVSGDNTFVVGMNKNDVSCYCAAVNGKDFFEYDSYPGRKEVESDFDNLEAERKFNEYEAEFGADGRRVFPHLNDDIADKDISSLAELLHQTAEKIHDFLSEHDIAFGYAKGLPGQENKEQWIDTISQALVQGKANSYINHIMSLSNERLDHSNEKQDLISQIESCERCIKADSPKMSLDDKIKHFKAQVVENDKSDFAKNEREAER
ncbi:MAG: DUF4313 domain-containing protein [Lachnospiraceae bacterium]|nr:DUF4313 domain-containing protein [Lachnospiraceae bacterium]